MKTKLTVPIFSLVLLCIFIAPVSPPASAATRVFYDDLESGNISLWSQGGSNDRCTNVSVASDGNSAHGGSYMMQCNWNGTVAWNDPASYSSAVLGSWSYTNEFLIRMWVRADNDVDHKFGSKWIRITGNYPTNSFIADGQMEQSGGPIYTNIECLDGVCNNWYNYGSGLIGNTRWHKLEFYSKGGSSSIFRIWVDDNLEWEKTGFSSSQKWNELNIVSNWSDNGPEWTHDANNHTYWDDFEIYSDATTGTPATTGTMANGDVQVSGGAPDTTPPTSPTGLTATATSQSSITVSWNPATDDVGVVRYDVQRCTGLSCSNFAVVGTPSNSPFTDSSLSASTGYSYHVRAVDAVGNVSGWSNVVGATTQGTTSTGVSRVFYDGSEAGNTNLWSQDDFRNKCSSVASGSDGTTPYAGSRMISCNENGTVADTASNRYETLTIPTSNYTNEFFIRTHIRVDTDHDITAGSAKKLLRIFYWDGNQSTYKDSFEVLWGSAMGYQCNSGSSACSTYWGSASGDNTGTSGSWHLVEQYFNSSTGQVKIWHDNVLVTNQTVSTTSNKWTPFYITSNWSDAHDASNHLYFDDFEIYSDASSGTPATSGTMANGDVQISGGTPDTTPPTSPTGLTATATSQSSITISWTAATDNIGVNHYLIERCTGLSCSNFTQVGSVSASPFTDSGLSASTGYSYHVRAVDAAGNVSGWSNVVGATTQAPDTTPPSTPTNLTASASSSSTIDLTWTASTDNIAVTGYKVERCSGSGCTNFVQVATPTSTSLSDTGLTASTLYRYQVRATDGAGNNSSYSSIVSTTTQVAPPISQNLMLGMNFNEGAGATTSDVSGHNNTGTLQNGTLWNTQGKNGNSLTFDGTDDLVDVGNPSTLNFTSSFTLSAWIYPTSLSGDRDIITKVGSSSDYHLQITNNQVQIGFSNGGSWYSTNSTTTIPLNTWTHIAGVFDDTANTLSVYVNGTSQGSTSVTAIPQPSTNPVHIGMGWSGQGWNGRIDDVRIYNKALTQTEIQTDMNTPLTQGGSGTFSPCNTVTTSNFSQSAYNGYGAPYDAFQISTNLINATCSSSDSHTIQATLGQTGDTTRIVYTKGYYYANNAWTQYSGTCTGAQNGDWCQGSVSATITSPNLSTASASTPAYFVGMTCSVQGGSWRCGCRDTTCSNFYWQVQGAGL